MLDSTTNRLTTCDHCGSSVDFGKHWTPLISCPLCGSSVARRTCQDCKGHGFFVDLVVCRDDSTSLVQRVCATCDGEGEIS